MESKRNGMLSAWDGRVPVVVMKLCLPNNLFSGGQILKKHQRVCFIYGDIRRKRLEGIIVVWFSW